jgi:DNA replication factor GINS
MNLDELRSAQAKERRKDSLQHLRDSFYDDVGAYVADLRAARDRRAEQVENPFEDDDIRRLSDEVETAEEVAEALYERRVGKVVKLASFAAADMSVDEEGMTTEERRLFDDLVERITANKSEVLDVLAGDSPASDDASESAESPVSADESASSDPAPSDPVPSDPAPGGDESAADAASTEPSPGGANPDEGSAPDALAGAMGGNDADAPTDAMGGNETEPPTDAMGGNETEPPADAPPEPTEGDAAAGDDEPTPVPPEPAPPGAVGADDAGDGRTDETDAAATDRSAGEAGEGVESGATTDGGPMPEATAGDEPDVGPEPDEEPERATVRITRDIGAIFGVDEREYELASEDVVSLPVENADPLVQRDAAKRID